MESRVQNLRTAKNESDFMITRFQNFLRDEPEDVKMRYAAHRELHLTATWLNKRRSNLKPIGTMVVAVNVND